MPTQPCLRPLEPGAYASEDDAIAKMKAQGLFPVALDVEAEDNAFHVHDFSTVTYLVSGALKVTLRDSGEAFVFKAGDAFSAPPHLVHRETHDGYRGVFGLSVHPRALTRPIDKPAPDL